MPEFIYSMHNVRKALGDKVVLDNITLSFYPGAKIGVVGPNGTGKSTLLKLMAGIEKPNNGDAMLAKDASVGILLQEPPLTEGKTVLENVEEAVADIKALQTRMDELGMAMGEPDADFDALMAEMGDVQTELDHRNAWDIDSQLEQAMDALRCPPPDAHGRHPLRRRAPPGRAVQAAAAAARSAAARRADEPPGRGVGALAGGPPQGVPGRGAGRHPRPVLPGQRGASGSSRSTAGRPTRTRATTRPTWRPSRSRLQVEGKRDAKRAKILERELEWARSNPKARQAKNKARLARYEETGRRGGPQPQARLRGDQHPAGSAAGQQRAGRGRSWSRASATGCCSTA